MAKIPEEANHSLATIIHGLTPTQSEKLSGKISQAKHKIAPESTGTTVRGPTKEIGFSNKEPKRKRIGGTNNGKKK
jgi:hypothetical protein